MASTKAGDFTRPCGTCRQILLEHAARSGCSIDVVMVGPKGAYDIRPIEALLPDCWLPAPEAIGRDAGTRIRRSEPRPVQSLERLQTGDQVLVGGGQIALVWDPAFMPGLVLLKPKYLRQADGWAKVPHSFTESALHDVYRERHGLDREVAPGVHLPVVPTDQPWKGWPAVPLGNFSPDASLPTMLCESLGIPPESAYVSGSLATGLHAGGNSDVDLVVRGDGAMAGQVRQGVAAGILQGRLAVEESSRSLQLVTAIFGGQHGQLVKEGRYAESLRIAERPVSVMYALREHTAPAVVPATGVWERACIHGVVTAADGAVSKRSSWTLQAGDEAFNVVCYHRAGNLVRTGDWLSAAGWLVRDQNNQRVLLQFAIHRDTIAWFHSPWSC